MKASSTIELRGLKLPLELGTYGPDDIVPEAHLLDLTLTISSALVLVKGDRMEEVFDYDPLIVEIDRLARDGYYETQEFFMTRVVKACAQHQEIEAVEITVTKRPVLGTSGSLGVKLKLDSEAFAQAR